MKIFNKIILTGTIDADPEIQRTRDRRQVAKFPLIASSMWNDETGEWREHTARHEVIVFREETVRWLKDILKKGELVCVEGTLAYRHDEDKQGRVHWTFFIVVSEECGKVEQISLKNPLKSPAIPEELPEDSEDEDDWEDFRSAASNIHTPTLSETAHENERSIH